MQERLVLIRLGGYQIHVQSLEWEKNNIFLMHCIYPCSLTVVIFVDMKTSIASMLSVVYVDIFFVILCSYLHLLA